MQDRRRSMKGFSNAMTAKILNDGKVIGFGVGLNCVSDVAKAAILLCRFDAKNQAFVSDGNELVGLAGYGANGKHATCVTVVPIQAYGDIDVEDAACHKRAVVGDAVADHMVDGGADGFWVAAIVEWSGCCFIQKNEVMAAAVDLVGGASRHDEWGDHVERGACKVAGAQHPLKVNGG